MRLLDDYSFSSPIPRHLYRAHQQLYRLHLWWLLQELQLSLGAYVEWRRWLAIFICFSSVLMILRPGLEGFVLESFHAVTGTLGFAGRDLATRVTPSKLSKTQLRVYGLFILLPTGIIMTPFTGGFLWIVSIRHWRGITTFLSSRQFALMKHNTICND